MLQGDMLQGDMLQGDMLQGGVLKASRAPASALRPAWAPSFTRRVGAALAAAEGCRVAWHEAGGHEGGMAMCVRTEARASSAGWLPWWLPCRLPLVDVSFSRIEGRRS